MRRFLLPLSSLLLLAACECSAGPETGPGDSGANPRPDSGPSEVLDSGDTSMRDGGPHDECYDGLDNDRDGEIDEGCRCVPGEGQRCFGGDPDLAGVGVCVWGTQQCTQNFEFGRWDDCVGAGEPADEICDGVDNDCDGETDEGCDCTPGEERLCYDGPGVTEGVGSCVAGRVRCVETESGSEWTACEGSIGPAEEVCDGTGDEDCDGAIDEGCACSPGERQSCYGGAPGTAGVGECRAGEQLCEVGAGGEVGWGACSGEVRPTAEGCTGGADEDCDGLVDCEDPDCETACCTPYHEVVPVVPAEGEILFVVDRSGSMDWPAQGTSRTRWEELLSAAETVLPMLDGLPMGLLTFPRLTGDSETGNCMVSPTLDVDIALGTRSSIQSTLVAADPRAGDTPTPQAFMTAEGYLTSNPTSRERFIVLMTDGLPEPNCGSTVDATVAAITDVRSRLGIDTFVIGIVGPDPDGDTSGIPDLQAGLNRMADAGGRARTGSIRYYEAVDGPALTSAMQAVLASATNCRFELTAAPARPSDVDVRLDSSLVPTWGYSLSGRSLEFFGSYCDQIQAGAVSEITVADSCS